MSNQGCLQRTIIIIIIILTIIVCHYSYRPHHRKHHYYPALHQNEINIKSRIQSILSSSMKQCLDIIHLSNIDYWSEWKDLADTSLWKLLPVHVICWGCTAAWAWFQDIWLLPPYPALPRNQYFKCSMTSRFIRRERARLPYLYIYPFCWQTRLDCSQFVKIILCRLALLKFLTGFFLHSPFPCFCLSIWII